MGCKNTKSLHPDGEFEDGNDDELSEPAASNYDQVETENDNVDTATPETNSHRGAEFSLETMKQLFDFSCATSEQIDFFDTYWKLIVLPLLVTGKEQVKSNLQVYANLSCIEHSVTFDSSSIVQVVNDFLTTCKIPNASQVEFNQVYKELNPKTISVWCRLRNMVQNCANVQDRQNVPSIDIGYTLNCDVSWQTIDVLMPDVDDQDAVRLYALQEKITPSSFSSSLLPIEPERRISFSMLNNSSSSPSRMIASQGALLSAFFFFKSLGFSKPSDSIIRILSSCQPRGGFTVNVCMGPKGLTRLGISVHEPKYSITYDLCESLGYYFDSEGATLAENLFGSEPLSVDYTAESSGYIVNSIYSGHVTSKN